MRIRSTIHLNERDFTLQLYPVMQETWDHLVLKLAACVLFHQTQPLVISSSEQHPALSGGDYCPDLLQVDLTNQVTLWFECGKTTINKLNKASKRHRQARLIMLLSHPYEGKQMKDVLEKEDLGRMEVWTFPDGDFARWKNLVQEQNDIVGEADERSMNLVINGEMFVTDMVRA